MVDAPVLETGVERRMGSTPFIPTNNKNQGGWPSPPETQILERGQLLRSICGSSTTDSISDCHSEDWVSITHYHTNKNK